jgi:hypothetical protein
MKTNHTCRAFICSLMFLSLAVSQRSFGQGCVAVRPMSCSSSGHSENLSLLKKHQWQEAASFRYFESYKHFKGDSEQSERVEDGTEVRNISRSLDLSLLYAVTNRLSFSVNVPFISYNRSSMYEHYGNSITTNPQQMRFRTAANGIGDIRVTGYYWLFNPANDSLRKNISIGLGVKAPTGNDNVTDVFHKRTKVGGKDSLIVKPVDQSIQLGDGGWGINLEAQMLLKLSKRNVFFFNGFYLFNPDNTNGVLTSGAYATTASGKLTEYFSVADQFAARTGISWIAMPRHGISLSVGPRIEGVPSKDIIGKSEGFRRPGYIISVEPGIAYQRGNLNFSLLVPYALYRNRTKSYSDLEQDKMFPTVDHHGDAAFADYLINFSASYRFGACD